jgi:hypothetical protein
MLIYTLGDCNAETIRNTEGNRYTATISPDLFVVGNRYSGCPGCSAGSTENVGNEDI